MSVVRCHSRATQVWSAASLGRRSFAAQVWGVSPSTPNVSPQHTEGKLSGSSTGRGGNNVDGGRNHFSALESLVSSMPEMPKVGNLTKYIPTESQDEKASRIFQEGVKLLMQADMWTYGAFLNYQRKIIELLGGHSLRTKLTKQKDPNIEHLEKEARVLEAMTPSELRSNHHSVFRPKVKKLIAEKAGVRVAFVDQVLMMHDAMRADRRWYKIRMQFNRRLPTDFVDRQQMAEMDRPMSGLEYDETKRRQKAASMYSSVVPMKKMPRITTVMALRHVSVGGDRWSTQPPRWYPRWRVKDIPDHMRYNR